MIAKGEGRTREGLRAGMQTYANYRNGMDAFCLSGVAGCMSLPRTRQTALFMLESKASHDLVNLRLKKPSLFAVGCTRVSGVKVKKSRVDAG
jgi:hypothetical protein